MALEFMEIKREQLRLETERNVLLNLILSGLKKMAKELKDIKGFLELTISK